MRQSQHQSVLDSDAGFLSTTMRNAPARKPEAFSHFMAQVRQQQERLGPVLCSLSALCPPPMEDTVLDTGSGLENSALCELAQRRVQGPLERCN